MRRYWRLARRLLTSPPKMYVDKSLSQSNLFFASPVCGAAGNETHFWSWVAYSLQMFGALESHVMPSRDFLPRRISCRSLFNWRVVQTSASIYFCNCAARSNFNRLSSQNVNSFIKQECETFLQKKVWKILQFNYTFLNGVKFLMTCRMFFKGDCNLILNLVNEFSSWWI